MPAAYAADVPLICDQVPGPGGIIIVARQITVEEVMNLRQLWLLLHIPSRDASVAIPDGAWFQPFVGARTEWPDAEFCAA